MLNKFLTKYRKKLIVPVTIIVGIIGFINIYFILNVTTRTNDECIWKPKKVDSDSLVIYFDLVKYKGVTWNAGIRDGDIFLKIDGKKLRNLYHASYLADRKATGDSLIFTVSREGKVFDTTIKVKKIINIWGLAFSILGLIWLAVGFVVLSSKPYGFPQILFYRIGILFILSNTVNLFSGNFTLNPVYEYPLITTIVDLCWVVSSIFLPFVFVYFFWAFPLEKKIIKKKYTAKLLFYMPLVFSILAIISRVYFIYYPAASTNSFDNKPTFALIGFINLLTIIALIIGLISLFKSFFKLKDPTERAPIFIVLLGYTVGLASIIYVNTFANVLAESIFNNPEYYLPIFLIILLPLSFGYSIFRYSLLDVSEVLKNTILYGTATITIAGGYFLLIYVLGQYISEAVTSEYQGVVAGAVFIIFALIFQSTKDRFQNIITKYFYPEQFAYQNVLMKFSNEISTIVGLDKILDSVLETFVDSLKVEKFGIAIKDFDTNEFILKREDGIKNANLILTNCENIITEKINEKLELKRPISFDQAEFENVFPDNNKELKEEGIYTIIPLYIKKKIVGLLLFGLKHSGAQFAGKDIELLIAAANQTAVSLENARLYEEETKKIKLERELIVARQIQEGLLPVNIPKINNLDVSGIMIPAMHVGGDYYDVIKISDTQMFIVVGDVSGKGLSASFYMSKLQTMIQLFCTESRSPKEVLFELNKRITGTIDKQWFITLTIAFVDLATRKIKICRAGHTPTLKFSDGVVQYIKPKGIGIGLESGDLFKNNLEELELNLSPRDIYIFSSDGVNEAMNSNSELFGYEKVISVVKEKAGHSAKEILNSTLQSLEVFRGKIDPNDDITMVVLKVL
ncbi:MAG: SpoIIE family protein phosphatase [Ignavibacteriae bacterium]|nr:SpoIIE family protein phosphatase [Ignavibacteriota bacterium]